MSTPPVVPPYSDDLLAGGERRVLELIAGGAPLAETLDALCRAIDSSTGLMSAVFLINRDADRLVQAAAPHWPAVFRDATRSFVASPPTTACGAAVHRREQVIVVDVAVSPLFAEFRGAALAAGFGSAWSTPFTSKDGQVLGTFAMASSEKGEPSDANQALVARATHLASIAVERHQTEVNLRESERRFATAFYSSPGALTISRHADGRFMYVNDRFVTLFGYSRAEAVGATAHALGLFVDPDPRAHLLQLLEEHRAHAVEIELRTKSGAVLHALVWMDRIEILGEECVLTVLCDITERTRVKQALAQSEHLLRVVLDALPVGVAVVNQAGDIILNNPVSRRIWSNMILPGPERYAKSKGWWHATGQPIGPDEWGSARALSRGESALNEVVDIEAFDGVRKVIENSAVPIRDGAGRISGAVIVNAEVSARVTAEQELQNSLARLRALTGRLMRAQDDERRRIAQMLHETTAQDLAALKMQLASLSRTTADLSDVERAAIAETIELAEQSMTGVRTLSYLLHPPFLDESGLTSALRWYAEGFARRSGIPVEVDLPATFQRLPQDVETALFRVVQEGLINIHRHAESASAAIRLRAGGGRLVLEIADRGRGIPPEVIAQLSSGGAALGVGVPGMRERLQQVGGTLTIESSRGRTVIHASVPLAEAPA
jgi:PAS domain S-box-containing protein